MVSVSDWVAVKKPVPCAVTVRVEVTGEGPLPLPALDPPPPHPLAALIKRSAHTTTANLIHRLRRKPTKRNKAARGSRPSAERALADVVVCTLMVTGVVLTTGVRFAAEGTMHVYPEGAPLHEKTTDPE